jgi:hypothetical protein
MRKPVGGRGKKVPYESVTVRVPVPIRTDVEYLVDKYVESVLSGGKQSDSEESKVLYEACLKLVMSFVDEHQWTEKMNSENPPRNFTNLIRFRDWLQSRIDSNIDV